MSDKNTTEDDKSTYDEQVHDAVRAAYATIAVEGGNSGCCAPTQTESSGDACCSPGPAAPEDFSARMGYSEEEMAAVPDGSNLGLGCGNPSAIAAMQPGEVVIDLGSGAGFDAFLAARQVGETGHVIGVDMTHEMLHKARENAVKVGLENVEFRLGEIEHLPVADNTADVIISNCVINLSPEKAQVLKESFRVLKPGGRIAVSDVVATAAMPQEVLNDEFLLCGCVSGAAPVADLTAWLQEAGFESVEITVKEESRDFIKDWAPGSGVENYVASANIEAVKPQSS